MSNYHDGLTWAEKHTRVQRKDVSEHQTFQLRIDGGTGLGMMHLGGPEDWVFTFARTGCLRVQRGDFCAYIAAEALDALVDFIYKHRPD